MPELSIRIYLNHAHVCVSSTSFTPVLSQLMLSADVKAGGTTMRAIVVLHLLMIILVQTITDHL